MTKLHVDLKTGEKVKVVNYSPGSLQTVKEAMGLNCRLDFQRAL